LAHSTYPSRQPDYRAAYWQKYRRERLPYVTKTCADCGAPFSPRTGTQARCDDCMRPACPVCGARFKQARRTQRTCSRKCAALADPERTRRICEHRGNKPRTYHLRHRDKHGSAADREWREKVFERDDWTCQACGKRGGRLQAHHIKPFKEYPDLRHSLSNGQTLCIACHRKTETYGWSKYWHGKGRKRCSQEVLDLGAA